MKLSTKTINALANFLDHLMIWFILLCLAVMSAVIIHFGSKYIKMMVRGIVNAGM